MPRIHDSMLDSTFFLYPNKNAAKKGEKSGGSGFFVACPSDVWPDDVTYLYAVTNWHVAVRDGCSVIRLNTTDGKTDLFELDPSDWEFDPQGDDLAVIFLQVDESIHKTSPVPIGVIKGQREFMANNWAPLGVGDDVFMLGRFVDIDSSESNFPTARFGNVSAMSVELKQATGVIRPSILVDMHSRTGYSGSPVFVYRTPGTNIAQFMEMGSYDFGKSLLMLLGVHFGQFDERDRNDNVIGQSAMSGVVPATQILELLQKEKFIKMRAENDAAWGRKFCREGPSGTSP
ncbi:MAG: serine protease, partial [Ramlibacter sp.]